MPENIKRDEKEVIPKDKKKEDVEAAKTEELDKSEQDKVAGGVMKE
jgi:hypothetical protein